MTDEQLKAVAERILMRTADKKIADIVHILREFRDEVLATIPQVMDTVDHSDGCRVTKGPWTYIAESSAQHTGAVRSKPMET